MYCILQTTFSHKCQLLKAPHIWCIASSCVVRSNCSPFLGNPSDDYIAYSLHTNWNESPLARSTDYEVALTILRVIGHCLFLTKSSSVPPTLSSWNQLLWNLLCSKSNRATPAFISHYIQQIFYIQNRLENALFFRKHLHIPRAFHTNQSFVIERCLCYIQEELLFQVE